jgi:hypothetical protein
MLEGAGKNRVSITWMSAKTSHSTNSPTGATNPISRSEESRDKPPFLADAPRMTIAPGSFAGGA